MIIQHAIFFEEPVSSIRLFATRVYTRAFLYLLVVLRTKTTHKLSA